MTPLREIIDEGETWLVARILDYAKRHGYTAFTSTLEAPWRASICGLSRPMIAALDRSHGETEMTDALAFVFHDVADFAAREARQHRTRGVERDYYAALLGYYRRTYLDLLRERGADASRARVDFVNRYFDHVDTATHAAWGAIAGSSALPEARAKILELTNEKNRLLTVIESIADPVILLRGDGALDYANRAALDAFSPEPALTGEGYYDTPRLPLLEDGLGAFVEQTRDAARREERLLTRHGPRFVTVSVQPMLDLSEKFIGLVVVLHDVMRPCSPSTALRRSRRCASRRSTLS